MAFSIGQPPRRPRPRGGAAAQRQLAYCALAMSGYERYKILQALGYPGITTPAVGGSRTGHLRDGRVQRQATAGRRHRGTQSEEIHGMCFLSLGFRVDAQRRRGSAGTRDSMVVTSQDVRLEIERTQKCALHSCIENPENFRAFK
jgi:hypothetical protein